MGGSRDPDRTAGRAGAGSGADRGEKRATHPHRPRTACTGGSVLSQRGLGSDRSMWSRGRVSQRHANVPDAMPTPSIHIHGGTKPEAVGIEEGIS